MPGKRKKDKKLKTPASRHQSVPVIPPMASVDVDEAPAVKQIVRTSTAPPSRAAKPVPVSVNEYINRELLFITLLASVMLAVVIIMSLVLR